MASNLRLSVCIACVLLFAQIATISAATINVSWVIPPVVSGAVGKRTYNAATTTLTVCKGDSVNYSWSGQAHDLQPVSQAQFDECMPSGKVLAPLGPSGAKVVQYSAIDTKYYLCSVPGHCTDGQKIKVAVKKC